MTETTVTLAAAPDLPGPADAGRTGEWRLPVADGDEQMIVTGRFLGVGSSARRAHSEHVGRFARVGERCPACRWFEARIFRFGEEADGDYVVYNVGQSAVPGETPRYTLRRVATAEEVVDFLTTRRSGSGDLVSVTISLPAEVVLSQASHHDVDIREVYVNSTLA